jgi:hypothetical protein
MPFLRAARKIMARHHTHGCGRAKRFGGAGKKARFTAETQRHREGRENGTPMNAEKKG